MEVISIQGGALTAAEELEQLVLKESIISTTGLHSQSIQVGLKGDPSLRETALFREKYPSILDEHFEKIVPVLHSLLIDHGIYRIYIGFNSASIRTSSIFDPLREETHSAERFLDPAYVTRHFPRIDYLEKERGIRELYNFLRQSFLFDVMPPHWQNITMQRPHFWKPMVLDEVEQIFSSLHTLRALPGYYLRDVTICLVQSVVRMQFNCDGTQLVKGGDFKAFMRENLPDEA